MSQLMFLYLNSASSTMFVLMKHPMAMGMALLIQTILVCITTGSMSKTTWFSYILFLVFLGGMLILFIYMTSVASNELFMKIKMIHVLGIMISFTMMAGLFMMIDPLLLTNNSEEAMDNMNKTCESNMVNSLFNYPNNIMTIVVVVYLFLTLIVVVNITESHQGPLRSSN